MAADCWFKLVVWHSPLQPLHCVVSWLRTEMLHLFLKSVDQSESAQEITVATVVEVSGGVARRSGDRGGGSGERRSVRGKG